MRYPFIALEAENHRITLLCKVMQVSTSSYYDYQKRCPNLREKEDETLSAQIIDIHRASRQAYGKRRIQVALRSQGQNHSLSRIARLMNESDIQAKATKKFKVTTDSNHRYDLHENLLDRKFDVGQPNTHFVADITYIYTKVGFLYLAVVLDLFSRKVVGWSMANHLKAELVCEALRMAKSNRGNLKDCVHHSDRGVQYAALPFQYLLNKYGMICSMSRKGNCWDNSVCESFFHSLKVECLDDMSFDSHEEAKLAVFDYIEVFYNKRRMHSYLGYTSPAEFEKMKNVV